MYTYIYTYIHTCVCVCVCVCVYTCIYVPITVRKRGVDDVLQGFLNRQIACIEVSQPIKELPEFGVLVLGRVKRRTISEMLKRQCLSIFTTLHPLTFKVSYLLKVSFDLNASTILL